MSKISVADRIKEISYSVGTGDFVLSGAAQGFSSFASSFNYGDIVYYAIIDGSNYEIGSGEYLFSAPNSIIRRYPFKSTNNDNLINFPIGTKQVYVTYPGQKAVLTASNFGSFASPKASGLAFWGSEQILDYDPSLIWDALNNRLGINKPNPAYAIDVGGSPTQAIIRASGVILGASGIVFPQGTYSGGQQQEPFFRNVLDVSSGADLVFSLSGLVSERINLKKQVASTIFMGPPAASPQGYPSFRALSISDVPDLSTLYVRETGVGENGRLAFYKADRIIGYDSRLMWDDINNYLGVNNPNPTQSLDVVGNAIITGGLLVNSGVTFSSGVPSVITNKLYNAGSQLYFNGFPIGASGATGATGASGISGVFGSTGATGVAGVFGSTGATGLVGASGATGATGISGVFGSTGATGVSGVAGPTYTAGSGIIISANQISVSGNGIIASSGFQSTAYTQASGAFIARNSSFTLNTIDNGKTILCSGSSQVVVSVSGTLPLGFSASFIQTGPQAILYSGVAGAAIRNRQGHTSSSGVWAVTSLIHFSPTLFILAGDTSP